MIIRQKTPKTFPHFAVFPTEWWGRFWRNPSESWVLLRGGGRCELCGTRHEVAKWWMCFGVFIALSVRHSDDERWTQESRESQHWCDLVLTDRPPRCHSCIHLSAVRTIRVQLTFFSILLLSHHTQKCHIWTLFYLQPVIDLENPCQE